MSQNAGWVVGDTYTWEASHCACGYVISSSYSLTDNMKLENVIAMRDAIRKYGSR